MNNMKLGLKMLLSFLAVSVVLLAVGGIGVYSVHTAGQDLEDVGLKEVPSLMLLESFRTNMLESTITLYGLTMPLSPEERAAVTQAKTKAVLGMLAAKADYEKQLPKEPQAVQNAYRKVADLIAKGDVIAIAASKKAEAYQQKGILDAHDLIDALDIFWENARDVQAETTRAMNFEKLETPLEQTASLLAMQKWVKDYHHMAKDGQAQMAELRTLMDAFSANTRQIAGQLNAGDLTKATATRLAGRDTLTRIQALVTSMRADALAAETLIDEMRTSVIKELRPNDDAIGEAIGAVIALHREKTELAVKTGIQQGKNSVALVTGGMFAGFALSILLGLWLTRNVTAPLSAGVHFARSIADGNLDVSLNVHRGDELGSLAQALRNMLGNIREMLTMAEGKTREAEEQSRRAKEAVDAAEVARRQAESAKREGMLAAAGRLESIVGNLLGSVESLSRQLRTASSGAGMQRSRAMETAAAMDHMNDTVLEVSRHADAASEKSEQTKQKALAGAQVVTLVVESIAQVNNAAAEIETNIQKLGESAKDIGQIMGVITDIADQTNLLALNAAIEAARAGEAGRGFAVVADEVRKLAEKTMLATKEVGGSVNAIQRGMQENIEGVAGAGQAVRHSSDLAEKAGEALREIVELAESSAEGVRSIATAGEEQSAVSRQIAKGTEEVTATASETVILMEHAEEAVFTLSEQAKDLRRLMEELKSA